MTEYNQPALLLPVESRSPVIRILTVGEGGVPVREVSIRLFSNSDDFHHLGDKDPKIVSAVNEVLKQLSAPDNGLLLVGFKPEGNPVDGVQPAKVYIGIDVVLQLDTMFLHRIRKGDARGYYVKFGKAVGLLAWHKLTGGRPTSRPTSPAGSTSPPPAGTRGTPSQRPWIKQALHQPTRNIHTLAHKLHGLNRHGNISRVGWDLLQRYLDRPPGSLDTRAMALAHALAPYRTHASLEIQVYSPQRIGVVPKVVGYATHLHMLVQDLGQLSRLAYHRQSQRVVSVLQTIITQPQLALGLVYAGYGDHVARWLFNLLLPRVELRPGESPEEKGWRPGYAVFLQSEQSPPGITVRLSSEPAVLSLVRTVLSDKPALQTFRRMGASSELLRRSNFAHFLPVEQFSFPLETQVLKLLESGRKIPTSIVFNYADGRLNQLEQTCAVETVNNPV